MFLQLLPETSSLGEIIWLDVLKMRTPRCLQYEDGILIIRTPSFAHEAFLRSGFKIRPLGVLIIKTLRTSNHMISPINVNTFCNKSLPTFAVKSHITSKHHFDRKMSSTRYRFTFIASTLSEQFGHSRGHRIYNKNKTI